MESVRGEGVHQPVSFRLGSHYLSSPDSIDYYVELRIKVKLHLLYWNL